jgi:signal transduction histidine kinase
MLFIRSSRSWLAVLSGSTLLLVLGGSVFLYRWIDRASDADRLQERDTLEKAMRSVQADFSGAVEQIRTIFQPLPGPRSQAEVEGYLANLHSEWKNTAPQPQLIRMLSVGFVTEDEPVFRRFVPEEQRFETEGWPDGLKGYYRLLKQLGIGQGEAPFSQSEPTPEPDQLVLVVPVIVGARADGAASRVGQPFEQPLPPGTSPGLPSVERELFYRSRHLTFGLGRQREVTRASRPPFGMCFVEVDVNLLRNELLPALVQRHFVGSLSNYRLLAVTGDPWRVLYQSAPSFGPEAFSTVDAAVLLPLSRRFWPLPRFRNGLPVSASGGPEGIVRPYDETRLRIANDGRGLEWRLLARHQFGSIAEVTYKTRRRNLIAGFTALLVLGVSIIALVVSTERARSLARRQIAFVAGVSHELRTPLSVLQTAGFNLGRGALSPDRIRQYAATIQTESRRLSSMVEQILSYAGVQSGSQTYQFERLQAEDIVKRALAESAHAFAEAGWEVEQHIESRLPPVLGDRLALQSAVKNLLENALKYAAPGKWLRVAIACVSKQGKREVQVSVEDRGPGIDPRDLPHLFDPFYRGQQVLASAIPGAGLGLSLLERHVKAHGGRVSVQNLVSKGAVFTLHLPELKTPGEQTHLTTDR